MNPKFKPLNSLASDLFEKYNSSEKMQPFNVGIYCGDQRYHLEEIENMTMICLVAGIDVVYFDPKDGKGFEVYPSKYLSHEIKGNQLELKLKDKEIVFGLE